MKSKSFKLTPDELLQNAERHPDDSNTTLVTFFANCEPPDAAKITAIKSRFPDSIVIGCSSAGHFLDDELSDDDYVFGVMRFDSTQIKHISQTLEATDCSFEAGQDLARKLEGSALKSIFLLSEGLIVNGSELVRGINSIVDDKVVVTGGLAGDGSRFEKTWIFDDGEVESGAIVAVGLYGDKFQVAHGSAGGWDKFGVARKVTKSASNVLFELDGKPALKLYKEYLGERASGLPATGLLFPLALTIKHDGFEELVVRTILAVDEEQDSLTFAGDIPEGANAQLMRANFDRIVDGASKSAGQISQIHDLDGVDNGMIIAISCVGRRLVLGEHTEDELEVIREQMPKTCEQVGFYSYGELSPNLSGRCSLHNQTMTLTLFCELD